MGYKEPMVVGVARLFLSFLVLPFFFLRLGVEAAFFIVVGLGEFVLLLLLVFDFNLSVLRR